jgi:predicted SAM-dependent methyltransferase
VIDVSEVSGPIRIFLSAGPYTRQGFIPTQQEELDLLVEKDWQESFGERKVNTILAEHVWEHLTLDEGLEAASRCLRWLEPLGRVRCGVPDRLFPNEEYQRCVAVAGPGPAADHKIVYDYRNLSGIFETAGFQVKLLEWWDEQGVFHFEDWKPDEGLIHRSSRFDSRNQNGSLGFTSLILDAIRPAE